MRAYNGGLFNGLRNANFGGKQGIAAKEFLSVFNFDWRSMKPKDVVNKLINDAGYIKYWQESKDPDASARIENIRELITNVIATYDSLPEFLEHAALMTTDDNDIEIGDDNQAVNIMTIHAAKGLEFDTVFLPAWEDGIFPNDKAIKDGGMEEERRLAYVAITRARRRVVITNTMSRVIFGSRQYYSPARFIAEMDSRFLDFGGNTPRYVYARQQTIPPMKKEKSENIVGKLIMHSEMGRGVVIESHDNILTVAFNQSGIKKVARDFITIINE
jgi:DNA helicase-2/ATP-dependent DNA helicase PcrA